MPKFLGGTYNSKVEADSRVADFIKKNFAPQMHPSLNGYINAKLRFKSKSKK